MKIKNGGVWLDGMFKVKVGGEWGLLSHVKVAGEWQPCIRGPGIVRLRVTDDSPISVIAESSVVGWVSTEVSYFTATDSHISTHTEMMDFTEPAEVLTKTLSLPQGVAYVTLRFIGSETPLTYLKIKGVGISEIREWSNVEQVTKSIRFTSDVLTTVPAQAPMTKNWYHLFEDCYIFTQSLSNWDTSHVTDMSYMFDDCFKFNGDLSGWDVSNVVTMRNMFLDCNAFTRDISMWDVSSVVDMTQMFQGARAFGHSLTSWCVGKIPIAPDRFNYAAPYLTQDKLPVWGTCPIRT